MVEGLCFMSKFSYMTELRRLIVRNYFSVRQYLATVGFFVYIESDTILSFDSLKSIKQRNSSWPRPNSECQHIKK